jgi:hypothetical protein
MIERRFWRFPQEPPRVSVTRRGCARWTEICDQGREVVADGRYGVHDELGRAHPRRSRVAELRKLRTHQLWPQPSESSCNGIVIVLTSIRDQRETFSEHHLKFVPPPTNQIQETATTPS